MVLGGSYRCPVDGKRSVEGRACNRGAGWLWCRSHSGTRAEPRPWPPPTPELAVPTLHEYERSTQGHSRLRPIFFVCFEISTLYMTCAQRETEALSQWKGSSSGAVSSPPHPPPGENDSFSS